MASDPSGKSRQIVVRVSPDLVAAIERHRAKLAKGLPDGVRVRESDAVRSLLIAALAESR
jgi:hypothetical protein